MAGFFDQGTGDNSGGSGVFSDPTSMALLQAMASAFQSGAPSRMPVTPGMVLGNTIQGGIQGAGEGTKIAGEQAQTADIKEQINQRKLANTLAQRQFDIQTSILQDVGILPTTPSASGGSPSFGQTSQGGDAPTAGGAASGSGAAPAGNLGSPFMANAIRQSAIANAVTPGSGKDVMGKLIPAPTKAEQYIALAQAAPEGSAARDFWTNAAKHEAQGSPISGRPGAPLYDSAGNVIGMSPPAPSPGHQYVQTPNGLVEQPIPGGPQAEARNAGIQQQAIGDREAAQKAFQYFLDTGMTPPPGLVQRANGGAGAPQQQPAPMPPQGMAGTAPQGMPQPQGGGAPPMPMQARPPMAQPMPGMPGNPMSIGGGLPMPGAAPMAPPMPAPVVAPQQQSGPVVTDKPMPGPLGSMVPPPSEQAPIEKGADYLKKALPLWAETESDWSKNLQPAQAAEVRFKAIGDALKSVEAGTFTTQKAQINAAFKSLGLPQITDTDPAAVQIILKNNTQATLDLLKASTSRFTQMEFDRVGKALADPNMQPAALQKIIAESLGQTRYGTAIAQSWADAKRMVDPATGERWRNPIDYERAFTKANPMQGFVDRAAEEIGTLKGMPDATTVPKEQRPALPPGYTWSD